MPDPEQNPSGCPRPQATALARFSLEGRVALVTGAARGLGYAMARALASAGAQVVINGRDPQRLAAAADRLAAELADAGPEASPLRLTTQPPLPPQALACDVVDAAALRQAITGLQSRYGRLDIVINNVGVRNRKSLTAFSADEVRGLLETDLVAATLLAQAVLPGMQANGWGRLINVTSIAGLFGRADDAIYTAAKHGLTGLVRALAAEYGRHGITSNAIAPGGFRTEHNAAAFADAEIRGHFESRTPLGRWGEAEEIAGAALFLASDAASYVNGHVLVVDGGMTSSM